MSENRSQNLSSVLCRLFSIVCCLVLSSAVASLAGVSSPLVARRTGHGSRATSHGKAADAQGLPQPLVNPTGEHQASTDARVPVYDIPRFAINSPFDTEYDSPVPKEGKRLWAASRLWAKAPDFVVEKWLINQTDINFYNAEDSLVRLARSIQSGRPDKTIDLHQAVDAAKGHSLYARALRKGYTYLQAASDYFQHRIDLDTFKDKLERGAQGVS